MDSLFSKLTLADTHQDLARNIVSLRSSEDLFDDLSNDVNDQQIATHHEMATKPPHYISHQPIIHRPYEEAKWIDAVEFPFKNWTVSRYSSGEFGVWYGGEKIETTIYETVFHWRRFLADANYDTEGSVIERKVWWVRCDAALVDLRPHVETYPNLIHSSDYTYTHQIGQRLHAEGHPGLVSQSARCEGEVFSILNPGTLSNPRNSCYLTYRLTNNKINVEREPGRVWMYVE